MTCIVGIEHDGKVTIGADSASSDGYTLTLRADAKVFRRGPYLFGFTSSWRMGQLLRYRLDVPDDSFGTDFDAHMAVTFVDAVRRTLKDGGFATTAKGGAEQGGTFLVGAWGRLYSVFDDYHVARQSSGYDAVGSGGRVALGSLHTSADLVPRDRVMAALHAAAAHTPSVAGPFLMDTM